MPKGMEETGKHSTEDNAMDRKSHAQIQGNSHYPAPAEQSMQERKDHCSQLPYQLISVCLFRNLNVFKSWQLIQFLRKHFLGQDHRG